MLQEAGGLGRDITGSEEHSGKPARLGLEEHGEGTENVSVAEYPGG